MDYGKLPIRDASEVIAVGDIHGESEKLIRLLTKILPFLTNPKCHVVFVGDYFDVGPNPLAVYDILMNLKSSYPNQLFFLKGNHEDMLWNCLKGKRTWLVNCKKTLKQFADKWDAPDCDLLALAPYALELFDFLDNLLPYYESPEVIVTHAPITNLSLSLNKHALTGYEYILDKLIFDLLWLNASEEEILPIDKFCISGHQYKHHKQPRIFKKRAFIDAGCGYYAHKPLYALKYPGKIKFSS